jgi:predicted transcriptional regulator
MTQPQKLAVSALHVADMMTTEVHSVTLLMSIKQIIEIFLTKNISGAPVIDQSKKVISVIGQTDLMTFVALGGMDKPLNDFLKKLPKESEVMRVRKTDSFKEVFKQFLTQPVRRVIVTDDNGHLQGIVSKSNLLRAFMTTEGHLIQPSRK